MTMTIYEALEGQDAEQNEARQAPAHCPYPNECPRASLDAPLSFGDRRTTRWLKMNRYRRLLAERCVCRASRIDLRT